MSCPHHIRFQLQPRAMMPMSLSTMTFTSPRRKRLPSEESDRYSPSASSPSNVSLPSLPETILREEEDLGRYSPRAAVAGRLGELAIRGDLSPTPQFTNDTTIQKPVAQSLHFSWPSTYTNSYGMPESDRPTPSEPCPSGPTVVDNDSQNPTSTPKPSPKKQSLQSPRKKRTALVAAKARSQKRSPPPDSSSASEDPFTWQDSEITGHDPNDPSDDGYGINGLGFKPTASMAWSRSQKRQKQVAEWRTREAREAREKRREKRDGMELEKLRTIQSGAIQKKVKFDV